MISILRAHLIIAILTARFGGAWEEHKAAGWAACAMVWVYAVGFGYSWGPGAWILVSEVTHRHFKLAEVLTHV
jgi:hypothetical protein